MGHSVILPDNAGQKNPSSKDEYGTIDLTYLDDKEADPDYTLDDSPGSSSGDSNNASASVSTNCTRKRSLDPDSGCSEDIPGANKHARTVPVFPTEDCNRQIYGKNSKL